MMAITITCDRCDTDISRSGSDFFLYANWGEGAPRSLNVLDGLSLDLCRPCLDQITQLLAEKLPKASAA